MVARYDRSKPDPLIERIAAVSSRCQRAGSIREIIELATHRFGAGGLDQLEISSHSNSVSVLILDRAVAPVQVLDLPTSPSDGPPDAPLHALVARWRGVFSEVRELPWQLGVWGCDTGARGRPALQRLADALQVNVAGYRGVLRPEDYDAQGIQSRYTLPEHGAVIVRPLSDALEP